MFDNYGSNFFDITSNFLPYINTCLFVSKVFDHRFFSYPCRRRAVYTLLNLNKYNLNYEVFCSWRFEKDGGIFLCDTIRMLIELFLYCKKIENKHVCSTKDSKLVIEFDMFRFYFILFFLCKVTPKSLVFHIFLKIGKDTPVPKNMEVSVNNRCNEQVWKSFVSLKTIYLKNINNFNYCQVIYKRVNADIHDVLVDEIKNIEFGKNKSKYKCSSIVDNTTELVEKLWASSTEFVYLKKIVLIIQILFTT